MKTVIRSTFAIGVAALLVGTAVPTLASSAQDGATAPSRGAQSRERSRDGAPSRERGAKATAKVGEKAPAFTLPDPSGKTHNLSDWAGKTVVLQWINPDCPVCRRVMESGLVAKTYADAVQIDPNVVWITINSTNYMEPSATAEYLAKNKMPTLPALIDRDGTVGHLYGARTTPHLYVIDSTGVLRYDGAFDDDERGQKSDATNYVVNAVRQIKAGETVEPSKTRPYGCSVKYAQNDKGGDASQGRSRGGRSGGSSGTGSGR